MRDLMFLEFVPILVAVKVWDKSVTFWRDNQAVVHIFNSQSSRSIRVMRLVNALFWSV